MARLRAELDIKQSKLNELKQVWADGFLQCERAYYGADVVLPDLFTLLQFLLSAPEVVLLAFPSAFVVRLVASP